MKTHNLDRWTLIQFSDALKCLGYCMIIAAIAILASGCGSLETLNANTPHTTIKGFVAGQPFSIENPKDTILEGLDVTAGTNGTACIHIGKLSTVMNVANTAATAEAQVQNTTAIFNGVNTLVDKLGAIAKQKQP